MKKILIILVIFTIFLTSCTSKEEDKLLNQQRIVQATVQNVLKNYNVNSSTSAILEDWIINKQTQNDKLQWEVITYDSTQKRIKCIFEWSGEENDDLTLIYLLYAGNELLNNLK